MVSVDAVASHLGVCRRTVEMLAKERKIPAIKVGRVWRFDLKAVLSALAV
jgi:excisionase family DNA binding protein